MSDEKGSKRVSKTFRLSSEAVELLETISSENRMTQTEFIERLILSYNPQLDKEASNTAELLVGKLNAEYGDALEKLKTSVKLTDRNVEVILDMLNSIVTGLGISTYSSVASAPSAVYQSSKEEMKKRIGYQKQKADWRK